MTTARELMTSPAHTLLDTATLVEAAQAFAEHGVGSIPVVDADGNIAGVVTDRDIVVRGLAEGVDPEQSISHVMTETVVVVEADDDVARITNALSQNQVRRVPVVEGNQVIGIVSQADLALQLPSEQTGDLLRDISSEN